MTYSAIAMARNGTSWSGTELDLHGVADLDVVVEMLRDTVDGGTALMFLEEDDEYVAIVRVDGEADARAYLSDSRVLEGTSVAAAIFDGALITPAPIVDTDDELDDDEDEEGAPPDVEPAGDADLLADLGVSGEELTALCAEEGMLPADVIYAVCEKTGCVDVLEGLRGV